MRVWDGDVWLEREDEGGGVRREDVTRGRVGLWQSWLSWQSWPESRRSADLGPSAWVRVSHWTSFSLCLSLPFSLIVSSLVSPILALLCLFLVIQPVPLPLFAFQQRFHPTKSSRGKPLSPFYS